MRTVITMQNFTNSTHVKYTCPGNCMICPWAKWYGEGTNRQWECIKPTEIAPNTYVFHFGFNYNEEIEMVKIIEDILVRRFNSSNLHEVAEEIYRVLKSRGM